MSSAHLIATYYNNPWPFRTFFLIASGGMSHLSNSSTSKPDAQCVFKWFRSDYQIAPDLHANTTNQINTYQNTISTIWTNSTHIWKHPKHSQLSTAPSFSAVAPSIAWVADARPPSSCWASGRPPRRLPARSRIDPWKAGDWWNLTSLSLSVGENVVSVFWV